MQNPKNRLPSGHCPWPTVKKLVLLVFCLVSSVRCIFIFGSAIHNFVILLYLSVFSFCSNCRFKLFALWVFLKFLFLSNLICVFSFSWFIDIYFLLPVFSLFIHAFLFVWLYIPSFLHIFSMFYLDSLNYFPFFTLKLFSMVSLGFLYLMNFSECSPRHPSPRKASRHSPLYCDIRIRGNSVWSCSSFWPLMDFPAQI